MKCITAYNSIAPIQTDHLPLISKLEYTNLKHKPKEIRKKIVIKKETDFKTIIQTLESSDWPQTSYIKVMKQANLTRRIFNPREGLTVANMIAKKNRE